MRGSVVHVTNFGATTAFMRTPSGRFSPGRLAAGLRHWRDCIPAFLGQDASIVSLADGVGSQKTGLFLRNLKG